MADEDNAEPSSPVIEALRREKVELALRAEIAQSRRALAGLNLSDVKAPEGEIKIDGDTPIEGVVLAYRAIDRVADAIAARVAAAKPKPPTRVVLHDEASFKTLSALTALNVHFDLLEREAAALLGDATPEVTPSGGFEGAAGLAIPAAGALLASTIELASLFRKDVALSYGKIEPADRSLVVAVAGGLKAKGMAVIDSATTPVDPAGGTTGSRLCARLESLQQRRLHLAALGRKLANARNDRAATKRAGAEEQKAAEPEDVLASDGQTPHEAVISAAVEKLTAFFDALLQVDETTAAVRLAQMLDAEKRVAMIDADTAFLWLKLDAAGGGSRTTRSMFSGRVDYSGGAIASFALYDDAGILIDAGTVPRYTGFVTLDATVPKDVLPEW